MLWTVAVHVIWLMKMGSNTISMYIVTMNLESYKSFKPERKINVLYTYGSQHTVRDN